MGGGGDGGYSANQAEQEARKQKARDALNQVFGVAPTAGAPDRASFTKTIDAPSTDLVNMTGGGTQSVFDQAGYDAALAAHQAASADAAKNKSALEGLYAKTRGDAFSAGRRRLDDKYADAARQNKFALFAQGLNGGSVGIDEGALLKRTLDSGLLDLGAKADAAKADFQASDEATRLGLLQSIDAGMDQGSAVSSALAQLKNSSEKAAADAQGINLGDLFGDAGLLYTKSNLARGRSDAADWWDQNYRPRKSAANNGIVTMR